MKLGNKILMLAGLAFAATAVVNCGKPQEPISGGGEAPKGSTAIRIVGSSTVFPISQAMAEEFMKANSGVNITVGESGTSGGFKKFIKGEVEIADASRPIDEKEIASLKEAGIEFIEIPVAFDGLSVVVNKDNTWVDHLTVEELKKMWAPDSKVNNWKDVRAGFPDQELKLYGAGTDSGTFEYFTEAIVGKKKASRSDYTGSEDDNQLVQGVKGDKGALGYFGFAYYVENKDSLKIVKIDGGKGPIEPTADTINTGTYAPLSRPLFIYINKKALDNPTVKKFLDFYLGEGKELISSVGYVPLPEEAYTMGKDRIANAVTGSLFSGQSFVGKSIADVMKLESAPK